VGTGEFNAGGNPAVDQHPIQGGVEIILVALYKLLFLNHRSLIKNTTQTAVINIVFQRILIHNLTFRILVYIHFQK